MASAVCDLMVLGPVSKGIRLVDSPLGFVASALPMELAFAPPQWPEQHSPPYRSASLPALARRAAPSSQSRQRVAQMLGPNLLAWIHFLDSLDSRTPQPAPKSLRTQDPLALYAVTAVAPQLLSRMLWRQCTTLARLGLTVLLALKPLTRRFRSRSRA